MRRHLSRLSRFRPLLLVPAVAAAGMAIHGCKPRMEGSGLKTNDSDYEKATLDVNDLSYLLPKDKFGRIYPIIKVSESWAENLARYGREDVPQAESILRKEIYDEVTSALVDPTVFRPAKPPVGFKAPQMPFEEGDFTDFEYPNMVVTSFRIDPCAPSLTLDSARSDFQPANSLRDQTAKQIVKDLNSEITRLQLGFQLQACQTQVRLIIQPASPDFKTLKESTIHMVFTLNGGSGVMDRKHQDAVLALKRELDTATGIDTTGLMLQPHPGLAREGSRLASEDKGGEGARLVIEYLYNMLGSYPDSQVMAIIREKTDQDGTQHDVILGGGTSNGRYAPNNLTSSSLAKGFVMQTRANRGGWSINPAPVVNLDANADTAPLTQILLGPIDFSALADPNSSTLRTIMIADDPESTHFFVNDCITCHASSQIIKEMPDKSLASQIGTRFKVPPGIAGYPIGTFLPGPTTQEGGIMMRNLGYSRNRPIIGLRTYTETAALADYFNRDLRGLPNPGADCSAVEARIWARSMGYDLPGGARPYKLDYEKYAAKTSVDRAAPEDDLFATPGCSGGVVNKTIAARGDGQQVPILGQVDSPFVGKVTYTGVAQFADGPHRIAVTLGNDKSGRTMDYWVQTGDKGASFRGSWNLDTKNKITTTGQNMMFTFDVVGGALCDQTTLNTCLSLGKDFKNFGQYKGDPKKPVAPAPQPQQPAPQQPQQPQQPDPQQPAGGASAPSGLYSDSNGRTLNFVSGNQVVYTGGQVKGCKASYTFDPSVKSIRIDFSTAGCRANMWLRFSTSQDKVCFVADGPFPGPDKFASAAWAVARCYGK